MTARTDYLTRTDPLADYTDERGVLHRYASDERYTGWFHPHGGVCADVRCGGNAYALRLLDVTPGLVHETRLVEANLGTRYAHGYDLEHRNELLWIRPHRVRAFYRRDTHGWSLYELIIIGFPTPYSLQRYRHGEYQRTFTSEETAPSWARDVARALLAVRP